MYVRDDGIFDSQHIPQFHPLPDLESVLCQSVERTIHSSSKKQKTVCNAIKCTIFCKISFSENASSLNVEHFNIQYFDIYHYQYFLHLYVSWNFIRKNLWKWSSQYPLFSISALFVCDSHQCCVKSDGTLLALYGDTGQPEIIHRMNNRLTRVTSTSNIIQLISI